MKIAYCSDLHLEFHPISLKNTENADLLILAGDICVSKMLINTPASEQYQSNVIHNFFQSCSKEFPEIIYILGNHEHYHGNFEDTLTNLKTCLKYIPNLHIIDKESITFKDITFIGGTLWTDFNNKDNTTIEITQRKMNDFRIIYVDDHSIFDPLYAYQQHKNYLTKIQSIVKPNGKYVVIGHHAPSNLSIHPNYKNDYYMNGAYKSDLDEYITQHPEIILWFHGHTHTPFDYYINQTRILCNPRGYHNIDSSANDFILKYISI